MQTDEVANLGLTNQVHIRRENLDPNHYTKSLVNEGLRVGLLDVGARNYLMFQITYIIKDLILRYTKGESTSVAVETAERILCSACYSIDAYLLSFDQPEEALQELKTKDIMGIYENGLKLVAACVENTKKSYLKIMRTKLDVTLEAYNASLQDISLFLEKYNVVFGAHDTMAGMDYPLVFDDMNVKGIFYISNYLESLAVETLFCRKFSKEDIEKALISYGRICRVDYTKVLVNIFDLLLSNSIFSVLFGKHAGNIIISRVQSEQLQEKLRSKNPSEMDFIVGEAIVEVIKDLSIQQNELIDYIYRYKTEFAKRLRNAMENDSLHNMILEEADAPIPEESAIFQEGERMTDSSFRLLHLRILRCRKTEAKIKIIVPEIKSLEDFVDILGSDCLFEDEFTYVFRKLGDMELAVLGRIVLREELGEGPEALLSAVLGGKQVETLWQVQYMRFMRELDINKMEQIIQLMGEVIFAAPKIF